VIPFRLQCAGCQAKIVVKHDHLLGKTLPCPKCQHLIAVPKQGPISAAPIASGVSSNSPETVTVPPDAPGPCNVRSVDVQRENPTSYDSTAITKDDYGDWEEVLANLPENPLGIDPSQVDWGSPNFGASGEQIPFEPLETATSLPKASSSEWENQNLRKKRQILLVATIGILTSLLAVIAFFGFLQLMKGRVANNDPQLPNNEIKVPDNSPQLPALGNEKFGQDPNPNSALPVEPNASASGNDKTLGTTENTSTLPTEPEIPKPVEPKPNSLLDQDSTDLDRANNPLVEAPKNDLNLDLFQQFAPALGNGMDGIGTDSRFGASKASLDLDIESLQYPENDLFLPVKPKTMGDWNQAANHPPTQNRLNCHSASAWSCSVG
jgi:hypothetical protein